MIFGAHLLLQTGSKTGENKNFRTWPIYLLKSFNLAHNVLNPNFSPKNMALTYIFNKYQIEHD